MVDLTRARTAQLGNETAESALLGSPEVPSRDQRSEARSLNRMNTYPAQLSTAATTPAAVTADAC